MQYLSEPVWPELLPPPFPPPHQKPYTLVVSIDDLLVTSTWDVSICAFTDAPVRAHPPCSANMDGELLNDLASIIS